MDPLSIAAGIIALGQALGAVTEGIRSLATIRKAATEFLDLQNEVR